MGLFDRWSRRRRREDDLEKEIAAHLAMAERERVANGADPRSARLAAVKEFGNVTLTREATVRSWGGAWMEPAIALVRDFRYALRMIARSPGYAFVVVAVLTIGIGTNLVAFAFYNALAFAPLPGVPASSELEVIIASTPGGRPVSLTHREYRYLAGQTRTYRSLAGTQFNGFTLGRGGDAQRVFGESVTGNYFEVLGVRAQLGRVLDRSDDAVPRGHPVAMLSDGLWRRLFDANPAIVGRTIHVNAVPVTVVGVTDPDFHGSVVGVDIELFLPVMMQPLLSGGWDALASPDARFLTAIGRPRAGVGIEQRRSETRKLGRELDVDYPADQVAERAVALPIAQSPFGVQTYAVPIVRLVGATAAVLLVVVCANIAGLVLVRALARRGEIAARLALGATRARIVRLLVAENLLLAIPGAVFGLLLTHVADPYLTSAQRDVLSVRLYFNWDAGVLPLVALLLAGASALLCGVVPGLDASRSSVRAPSTSRLRPALVVSQVAASLVLLVGAVLAIRSFDAARSADPGFDTGDVASVLIDVRPAMDARSEWHALYGRLLHGLRSMDGVESASLMMMPLLMVYDFGVREFSIEGHTPRRGDDLQFGYNIVSPEHFRTLKIPLVAGRDFDTRDQASSQPVAVVNETLAVTFWGDARSAVGRRIQTPDWTTTAPTWLTIVGVARDIKYTRLNEQPRPYVYMPFAQAAAPMMFVHVRGSGDTGALLDRVRAHVQAAEPNVPVLEARPLAVQVSTGSAIYEVTARVLAFIGLAAISLAALGIYGLVAYSVKQSSHEIGIRVAIGAPAAHILWRFLERGLRLGVVGVAAGAVLSLAASRVMSSLLYGVTPGDVRSLAVAALAVLCVAAAASLVPAWRAARLDPVVALRRS